MITRRNIREKVMQILYSLESVDNSSNTVNPEKLYNDKILQFEKNFAAILYFVVKVAQYSEVDAANRANKLLPSSEDLKVSTAIAHNKLLEDLLHNASFIEIVKRYKLESYINNEWVKKIYTKLINTDRYKEFVSNPNLDEDVVNNIFKSIWKKVCYRDDVFQEVLEDEWLGYTEDKGHLRVLVDVNFKDFTDLDFNSLIDNDDKGYGYSLLKAVIEKKVYLNKLISDNLENWQLDRVALIDMILLKMGLAEFLYFPNIPEKVTMNEYIEIAKSFSTSESSKFINGILDNVWNKHLSKKIKKEDN